MTTEQKAKAYDKAIERAKEWYNPTEADSYTCIVESIFPELNKESEDEKMRKMLIAYFKKSSETYSLEPSEINPKKVIDWLEKQSDANKEYWRGYNEGKQCILDKYAELQKQGEKKSTDKFKVGDWVVYNNDICQIVKREEGCNKLVTVFGIEKELVNERNLSTARLWSITDAKDSDVLSDGTTIFIFKDLLSDGSVMSYCDYDTDSGESDAFCPFSMNLMCSKITPATKEQFDTLMEAMKDAGYTFDFEEKELKKIEQKSVWSEEDENRINRLIAYFEDKESFTAEDDIAYANWLKSLRPQKQWKPSDEQIKALEHFVRSIEESGYASPYDNNTKLLNSLFFDLKKLK